MPLYEYQCSGCGDVFEVLQKFSDEPLTECVKCSGQLEKLISPPAIQFKGSGWYITDYAKKNFQESSQGKNKNGDKESKVSPQKNSTVTDHASVHGSSS